MSVIKTLTACSLLFGCFTHNHLHSTPYAAEQPLKAKETQTITRAAFDLGSGSFRVAIGKLDSETLQINKILCEKRIQVPLGEDYKKNGTISPEVEARALDALQELITLAKQLAGDDVQIKGIATAVFRKTGKRGEEILNRLNEVAGSPDFIKIISARTEGKLGLLTAQIVALDKNPLRQKPTVAWDTGSSSFQISYEVENEANEVAVFAGNIGVSDVTTLYIQKILGRPVSFLDEMEYQPVSLAQINDFILALQELFPQTNFPLQNALINEQGNVVAVSDETSPFALVQALLKKNIYTKEEVKNLLYWLADHSDLSDFEGVYPGNIARIIPYTAYIYAVMDKLEIESIENFYALGNCQGLLITPEFWE